MDLLRLSPAPWFAAEDYVGGPPDECYLFNAQNATEADCDFVALARNAFDVMMRRGWGVRCNGAGRWEVSGIRSENLSEKQIYCLMDIKHPDPFTCLVEADKWYKENVENKPNGL